ncbi:MAG: class I SAM-dependent methyltransferase [Candidatus Babeliaceae bacterium]
MKKNILILALASIFIARAEDMPEPYRSLIELPEDTHNWLSNCNKKNLATLIMQLHPKVVVELGSWLGASAIFMASRLPESSILYAVDDWTASTDTSIQADASVQEKLSTLYQQFLSNVKIHKLTHKIIPVRMKTLEAARSLNVVADLIYVDASHDEESVYKDIMAWYSKLKTHGIMCGDDWHAASVRAGVNRAAHELGLSVSVDGYFWFFPPKM